MRVLHVATPSPLRLGVLARISEAEGNAGNTRPFFILESPTEGDDSGWTSRMEELRADYDALREQAVTEAALTLAAMPPSPGGDPLVAFVVDVKSVSRALRPPLDGLVVVLAPVWVRDAARWTQDLRALLSKQLLDEVRIIIVESEDAAARPVLDALGPASMFADARLDDADVAADVDKMIAAMAAAPPGAAGPELMGAAGPSTPPPPRPRVAPSTVAPAAAGSVPPALLTPEVPRSLRLRVLEAAQAMRKGDATGALRKQREARDRRARSAAS